MVEPSERRRAIVGPVVLLVLGVVFLYGNLRPEMNPWPVVSRYWPLALIFLGLGKLWDHWRLSRHPEGPSSPWLSGEVIALLILLLVFVVALSRGVATRRSVHRVESVERQGADSVRVLIEMPAGQLKLAGGASKLLEAGFDYTEAEGEPKVSYELIGKQGQLKLTQSGRGVHFGQTRNDWDLRLNNDVPMELKVEMGAGQGTLRLAGLALTKLGVQVGAGQLIVDLTGDWKRDLDAKIAGGVGSATIRLPKHVGVRVHATGGIGSIHARGLERQSGAYVNAAYRTSAVNLLLNIEGGIGEINLELEP
jgi:hypothetical protein